MQKIILVLMLAVSTLTAGEDIQRKMQCRRTCQDKHADCQRDCMKNKPNDRNCTPDCSDKYYTACQNQCK